MMALHTPSQNWHIVLTVQVPQVVKLLQKPAVVKADSRIAYGAVPKLALWNSTSLPLAL